MIKKKYMFLEHTFYIYMITYIYKSLSHILTDQISINKHNFVWNKIKKLKFCKKNVFFFISVN